jgi:hypothetical protein
MNESPELQGLKNFAEQFRKDAASRARDGRRCWTIRKTGKPHIYLENGEWLILEKTAPGEWWLSPLPNMGR